MSFTSKFKRWRRWQPMLHVLKHRRTSCKQRETHRVRTLKNSRLWKCKQSWLYVSVFNQFRPQQQSNLDPKYSDISGATTVSNRTRTTLEPVSNRFQTNVKPTFHMAVALPGQSRNSLELGLNCPRLKAISNHRQTVFEPISNKFRTNSETIFAGISQPLN